MFPTKPGWYPPELEDVFQVLLGRLGDPHFLYVGETLYLALRFAAGRPTDIRDTLAVAFGGKRIDVRLGSELAPWDWRIDGDPPHQGRRDN